MFYQRERSAFELRRHRTCPQEQENQKRTQIAYLIGPP